jgi:hypothetical protein
MPASELLCSWIAVEFGVILDENCAVRSTLALSPQSYFDFMEVAPEVYTKLGARAKQLAIPDIP